MSIKLTNILTGLLAGFIVVWVLFQVDNGINNIRAARICQSKSFRTGVWEATTYDIKCLSGNRWITLKEF